jgi:hypothetical protein
MSFDVIVKMVRESRGWPSWGGPAFPESREGEGSAIPQADAEGLLATLLPLPSVKAVSENEVAARAPPR